MCDEDVLKVSRVTTSLSVEVSTTVSETATTDDLHHSLSELVVVNWELVCIPTVLVVTTVSVDRTEHIVVNSNSKLVLECMTCESSVVNLDVHLEVILKTVSLKEADYSLCINIVLVL